MGWRASIGFAEGLKRTADWFGARPDLVRLYRERRI
jgi:hypothetical protein